MKNSKWSFEFVQKQAKKTLKNKENFEAFISEFWRKLELPGQLPQLIASSAVTWLLPLRRVEALVLSDEQPESVVELVTLMMRYQAFRWFVYLQTAARLSAEAQHSNTKKIKIGSIDEMKITELCMTMAFAGCVNQFSIAKWFGMTCLNYCNSIPMFWNRDALSKGKVAAYLLRLFEIWQNVPEESMVTRHVDLGIYTSIFEVWDNPAELDKAVVEICNLHVQKNVDADLPDSDGIYCLQSEVFAEFPVEVHFLQLVRKELRLPVPNPSHPMLWTALSGLNFPGNPILFDKHIHAMIQKCIALDPQLCPPWESHSIASANVGCDSTQPFLFELR